jgi:tetratricopeptide (TPR) repeat protein
MDKYYNTLKDYYNYDLARMDNQIRKIQFAIQEEVYNYNRRIEVESQNMERQTMADKYVQMSINEINNRNMSDALNYINQAIQACPDNKEIYFYTRGWIFLYGMGDFNNAIKDFSAIIQKYPKNADAYYNRALCYEYIQRYEKAEIDYSKCIIYSNQKNLEVYYRRGIITSALGDEVAAIEDYDVILNSTTREKSKFNDLATVYNNKAYCLVRLGNYDAALPLVNKALELDNRLAYIWDTRGELYYHKGLYQDCINDMNKAISLSESANSYYYRGLANIMEKRITQGREDLSKADELGHEKANDALLKHHY